MKRESKISRRTFVQLAGAGLTASTLGMPAVVRAQAPIIVAVPSASALIWLPYWVAVGEGYFKEEGLECTLQAVDGTAAVLQAVSAGQAQIGFGGVNPILVARARGVPVKSVYALAPKPLFGLLTKEETGISEPEELKGKIIGVGSTDGAEVHFTRAIMKERGLEAEKDYTFLLVGDGGPAAVAFLRDEIAAYCGSTTDIAILAARGIKLREITPASFLNILGTGTPMLESQLAETPDLVPKFGRALVRATRFVTDPANKQTALAHCATGNPQEGAEEFAPSLFDAMVSRIMPGETFADRGYGYQPPEHWQRIHDNAVAAGMIPQPLPDLSVVYTNEFVKGWNAK